MAQSMHIDLITEYILQKPGRPFEEIKLYAASIGATEQDIKEAIFQVSERMLNINTSEFDTEAEEPESVPSPSNFEKMKPFIKQYGGIVVSVVFGVVSVSILLFHSSSYPVVSLSPLKQSVTAQTAGFLMTSPVYAHQTEIDTKDVFSVPADAITLHFTGTPQKNVIGFFPYWMLDNEKQVNLTGLTGITLFGLTMNGQGNVVTQYGGGVADPGWKMWTDPQLSDFLSRTQKLHIKTYLTLKVFNNTDIESIITDQNIQKQLIANAISLVQSKSLNGINIDFEYLGEASDTDRIHFVTFLKNLSYALKQEVPNASLSVDTYLTSAASHDIFDIQSLSPIVDAMIIMGYDVHTPAGDPGSIAPMEGTDGIMGNVASYLTRVDPSKLLLGVAYYGYDWIIGPNANSSLNTGVPYADAEYASKSTKLLWDSISQTPYYTYKDTNGNTHEVHFDNVQSLGIKYDYVNKENLGGVAIWALGYEGNNQDLGQLLLSKFAK